MSVNIEMRLSDKPAKIKKQKKQAHDISEQLRFAKGDDRPHRSDPSSQAPRHILATKAVRG